MNINQLSIFLENRPGHLAEICRTLAANDISLVTLSLADTSDFGIVRMIVDDHVKAAEVLQRAGHVVHVSEVLAVTVPDRPGGMAEIVSLLSGAGCDIEYAYAFSFHRGEKAVLVFRFRDNARAEAVLAAAGHVTLNESQVEEGSR